jgi:hypothetical protein
MLKKITEVARVIRSKNCSPFELTLDIIFKDRQTYMTVKKRDSLNVEKIASAYGISEAMINDIIYFDPANAIKVTLPRPTPSGTPGDTDVYGAQQHAPLLKLEIEV